MNCTECSDTGKVWDLPDDPNARRIPCPNCRPVIIRLTHAEIAAFKNASPLRRGATDNQRKGERR